MKRRYFIILLVVAVAAFGATAQPQMDSELKELADRVLSLRGADHISFNKIKETFEADFLWTPMNELGTLQASECRPADNVPSFKLNRLLNQAESGRKFVYTHGDMLNGEDERYNYSLYERAIKSKRAATYELKGRSGKQIFVVVPYDGVTADLKVSLEGGKSKVFDDYIIVEANLPKNATKPLALTIENNGSTNKSFVILNYNSRK